MPKANARIRIKGKHHTITYGPAAMTRVRRLFTWSSRRPYFVAVSYSEPFIPCGDCYKELEDSLKREFGPRVIHTILYALQGGGVERFTMEIPNHKLKPVWLNWLVEDQLNKCRRKHTVLAS